MPSKTWRLEGGGPPSIQSTKAGRRVAKTLGPCGKGSILGADFFATCRNMWAFLLLGDPKMVVVLGLAPQHQKTSPSNNPRLPYFRFPPEVVDASSKLVPRLPVPFPHL